MNILNFNENHRGPSVGYESLVLRWSYVYLVTLTLLLSVGSWVRFVNQSRFLLGFSVKSFTVAARSVTGCRLIGVSDYESGKRGCTCVGTTLAQYVLMTSFRSSYLSSYSGTAAGRWCWSAGSPADCRDSAPHLRHPRFSLTLHSSRRPLHHYTALWETDGLTEVPPWFLAKLALLF